MKQTVIIIPIMENSTFLKTAGETLIALKEYDFILIDDGSSSSDFDVLEEYNHIHYVEYENCTGHGAAVLHGYEFARDMQYEQCLVLDPNVKEFEKDISELLENLKYGYDLVSASRILENYSHENFNRESVDVIAEISSNLNTIIEADITDPLSGIKGFKVQALENMELTEFGNDIYLQMFVQAHYFGLTFIEIPAHDGSSFGTELYNYEDPLGEMLSVLETERYLYTKGNLN